MAKGTCSIEGCKKPRRARGWCEMHYRRWRVNGEPGEAEERRSTAPIDVRFWAKINKNGPVPTHRPSLGRCWVWTASRQPRGYGIFGDGRGGVILAHRYAYESLVGRIPRRRELDHLCRNTSCVRPSHVEVVTHAENVRRGAIVLPQFRTRLPFNARKTHCKWGHEFTPENIYRDPKKGSRYCRECRRRRWRAQVRA